MPRRAFDRSALANIDPSKLGPESPLLPIIARLKASPRARNPSRDLEHLLQVQLMDWVRETEPKHPSLLFLFAVPNFAGRIGNLTARHGARLKAEGRRPGVPDILFPVRRGPYTGLAIELKAGRNKPTTEQKIWLRMLTEQGWLTDVCYSFADARDLILAYLSGASTQ